jgi:hypothetical protein
LPRKPGKHTPYFELVDAQSQSGCPICRLAYKATSRYLDSLLYEAVLDPDVRDKLKNSQGFCAAHVDVLTRKPGRALGVALIYRDILRAVADTLDKADFQREPSPLSRLLRKGSGGNATTARLQARAQCPACVISEQSERDYGQLLLAHLDDEKLYTAYSQGEGLCLRHLMVAMEAAPDEAAFRRLIEPQSERYRVMLRDLDEFIRKRDHRFQGEKYGEEGDVWLRVMNTIIGGAGMGLSAKSGGRRSPNLDD